MKKHISIIVIAAMIITSMNLSLIQTHADEILETQSETPTPEGGSADVGEAVDNEVPVSEDESAAEDVPAEAETDAQTEYETDPEKEDRANSWRYEDGEPIDDTGIQALSRSRASHPNATRKGIDVSEHQGDINWEKVKASGVDFAIIRCGFGQDYSSQDDKKFLRNVKECERLGIPYGVYIYSYAKSTHSALSEAQHVLRLISGHKLSYPVYYDMEDNSTIAYKAEFKKYADTFCTTIKNAGYAVGVYANYDWWTNHLTDSVFSKWHRWVAQYNSSCWYKGEYAMWQYSSTGSVSGISGNVDMNFLINYPKDHGVSAVNTFKDVSTNAWYTSSIDFVFQKGIMTGMNSSSFAPDGMLSRSQFASILHRLEGAPKVSYTAIFPDVPKGAWFTEPVLWASSAKVVNGYNNGNFGAADIITREQMAIMMHNYAKYKKYSVGGGTDIKKYPDAGKVSSFATDAMKWAVGNGIITGKGGTTLDPTGSASRAECAAIIMRFINKYGI